MRTAKEYWVGWFRKEPKTDKEKLQVAMIADYAEKRCEALAEILNRPHEKLKPLEKLYVRETKPIGGDDFIPDRTLFYEWITKKILRDET